MYGFLFVFLRTRFFLKRVLVWKKKKKKKKKKKEYTLFRMEAKQF